MKGLLAGIDLSNEYNDEFSEEIRIYRNFVSRFIDQIFSRHFITTALIKEKTYLELRDLDFHPSLTAFYFTRKMLDYYQDAGSLVVNDQGYLEIAKEIVDKDPQDEEFNKFLEENPAKQNFFEILRNIRDVADQVLFKGEDALLSLANDNFQEAMKLWENLMLTARVNQPCHQLILQALRKKAAEVDALRIFEGGAGIGAILRDGLNDPTFLSVLEKVEKYYFTDISLNLLKMGREALRTALPEEIYNRLDFRTANLDKIFLNGAGFTNKSSLDMIILEHVLYDVIDLEETLSLFHKILKPGGYLVFTMAYRTDPKDFFPFEYLQSTFQSYNKVKLEPGYRENIGYLTLSEWENSLKRAGFEQFEVYPEAKDHVQWPYGGILAIRSE